MTFPMASAASRFIAAGALVCPYSRVYGDKVVLYLRLWGFLSRKDNEKYRPLRLAAADGDAAAQIFRQLPDDGQSQTVALGRAAALITPVEAVEHMGQGFGRDHRPLRGCIGNIVLPRREGMLFLAKNSTASAKRGKHNKKSQFKM